jgi:hypothetical protein
MPNMSLVGLGNIMISNNYAQITPNIHFKNYTKHCVLLALSIGQSLCVNFYVSRANFLTTLRSHLDVTCSYYFWSNLLALCVGQRLCVNFYVSRANFLTTLRSHLDIT